MDNIILQGLDFITFFKEKNIANLDSTISIIDNNIKSVKYDNNIIKLSNYENEYPINENGDYKIKNPLLLEGICLTFLNKLNTLHFPKILDSFLCNNKLCIQEEYKNNSIPLIMLFNKKKDIILFQILYALYESSSIEFSHNDINQYNISIESVPSMDIEYIIDGKKITIFNEGINIKFTNFNHSRITVYDTYIFNENDRVEKVLNKYNEIKTFENEYDVPFSQKKDLLAVIEELDILTPQMKHKVDIIGLIDLIEHGISAYQVLILLFEITNIPLEIRNIKTLNESKNSQNYNKSLDSIINKPNNILNPDEILLYLLKNKYNRLAYRLIFFNPKSIQKSLDYKLYTSNIKILNLIYDILTYDIKYTSNVYDPIMLKFSSKEEWFNGHDNIIININNQNFGSNRQYFNNIPYNNLINEIYFENNIVNYLKTFKNKQYIDLNKYGINAVIDYNLFQTFLKDNQFELNLVDDNENIIGTNYEYLITSYQSNGYNTINAYSEIQVNSLRDYTYQWDSFINGYLRKGNDYFNSDDFDKYYNRIDYIKKNVNEKIIKAINNIDNAFLIAPISKEEIVFYRGTKDCFLYDGLNLGFISTTVVNTVAHKFKETTGCIYEMHIASGIPYIYMEKFSKFPDEKEILLPRNLIVTKRDQIGSIYIVDINLSSPDQFSLNNGEKRYNIKTIKNFYSDYTFNLCYKNKIIDGKAIDEITGDEITNSLNFNGMCYNISTLIKILYNTVLINPFNKKDNKSLIYYFADPFTRIRFSNNLIKNVLNEFFKDPLIINYHGTLPLIDFKRHLYYFFVMDGNLEIIMYLINNYKYNVIDKFAFGISVYNEYVEIFNYFLKNGNVMDEDIFDIVITKDKIKLFEIINEQNNLLDVPDILNNIFIVCLQKYSINIINYIIKKKYDIISYLSKIVESGLQNNDLSFIEFAVNNGYNLNNIDIYRIDTLVELGKTEILLYLFQNGYNILSISDDAISNLIKNNNISSLQFLFDNGYNLSSYNKKIMPGNRDILKLLRNNGYNK